MALEIWLMMILVGIIVVLLLVLLRKQRENDLLKSLEKELDQYTIDIETLYRQMRGIRHDYRNHLQAMQAFLASEQMDELNLYMQQLNNELNQVDTIIRTGNTVIDALVNTKLTQARRKGVELDATALAPAQLSIDNIDLAIILGNLLNNAIEATTERINVNEDKERFIRLYIAPMKGTLYINLTNTMEQAPHQYFLSLKAPNRQGYGIERIDRTVKKYQGIVNRQWEEGVFATEITIPFYE